MRWAVSVLVMAMLAACGSGGTASDRIAETRAKEQATAAGPTNPSAKKADGSDAAGDQAPEALSSFSCEKGDEDDWTAAGYVANDTKAAASYQVTVYVGPADGTTRKGSTQQVSNVKPGGSTRFEIDDIAADGDQCHVQVLRLTS